MSRYLLPIAVGVMLWASAGQAAANATFDCTVPGSRESDSRWGVAEREYWREIDSQVTRLRAIANGSDSNTGSLDGHVDCLTRNYGGLSGEQQGAVNTGSHIVSVAAAGGLLSGAYPVVERAFGYAAFTPILFNQISALEPKRDLYAGARIGVDRIAERYVTLRTSGAAVEAIPDRAAPIADACRPVWTLLRAPPAALPRDGAILAEARRLATQCEALEQANVDHLLVQQDLGLLKADLPRYYAADVVAFHENLRQRHRDMLFTPAETLAAILASPFRAADQLLTGESGQQAVEQIRTQRAFEGLNQRLTPLAHRLSRPDVAVGGNTPMPDVLTADPADARARLPTADLRMAAGDINDLRAYQRRDRGRVLRLLEAAERTELKFDYSATAGAVRISLEKPTPPPVSP